jgi:lysozyme
MRPIPELAVDFVSKWESCELKAYRDIVGVLTVGYGHTGQDVVAGLVITKPQARALLKDDLRIAGARLEARIGGVVDELADEQYAALLSFVFNLGANSKWTIWKLLKARKFDEVPAQLMRFVNAGGKVVKGLVNRRAAECALWASGHPEAVNEPPPSSVTRSTPTPPTPADTKPLVQSKSFVTTAVAGVTTATVAVGEVSKAVSPYAEQSELVGKAVMVLATLGAVLAVAALVLIWLKRKSA